MDEAYHFFVRYSQFLNRARELPQTVKTHTTHTCPAEANDLPQVV